MLRVWFTVALAVAAVAVLGEAPLPRTGEFHFVRLEYTDLPQFHRRFGFSSRSGQGTGWAMMDWPDAERHFSLGLQRLTRIDTGEPTHFRLTDSRLFDHPWLYATQVGWWDLREEETARLGEYLRRGGFLVVDDFFGPDQWEQFRATLDRALPAHTAVDLPEQDASMHVLYDIADRDRSFIPGTRHLRNGRGEAPSGVTPSWRAIYDSRGRMVVAINFNMDVADAWEYADDPAYPADKTSLAYKFGINYVIHAMTH